MNKVHNRDNIVILTNCAVAELKEKDQKLTAVILEDGKRLDLEGLFVAIGGKPATQFIQEIELENGYIKVNENMETSVKGIYAAGDVVSKKYYQIATAISDGAIAALAIKAGK